MADHCHNAPGLSAARVNPTLEQYLGDRQNDALYIESLLNVAVMSTEREDRLSILDDILNLALTAARDLNRDLDSVNLPEGGAA